MASLMTVRLDVAELLSLLVATYSVVSVAHVLRCAEWNIYFINRRSSCAVQKQTAKRKRHP